MPDPAPPASAPPDGPRRPWRVAALLAGMFAAIAIPLILSGRMPSRVAYDQQLYHEPTVRQFAAQWPRLDFFDYLSATTPGYHVYLAAVARLISPATAALQTASAAITAGLFLLLGWAAGRRAGVGRAVAVCLPVLASMYVMQAGVWLLPDNAGWLGVLAMLLIALRLAEGRGRTGALLLAGAAVLAALVLCRQIHAWTAGLLWVGAWIGGVRQDRGDTSPDAPGSQSVCGLLFARPARRIGPTSLALLATLPAVAILAYFVWLWGGLVPPRFAEWYKPRPFLDSFRSPAPAFLLAVIACFSPFYGGPFVAGVWRLFTCHRRWLAVTVVASAVLALVPPTSFDYDAGRRTGLWNLAARFPVVGGRTSPLIAGLAVMGGVAFAGWLTVLRPRERLVFLAAAAGFALSQTQSGEVWQRYVDPFVLILLALMAARAGGDGVDTADCRPWLRRLSVLGPVALALALTGVNALSAMRGKDTAGRTIVRVTDPPPPTRAADHRGLVAPPAELPRPVRRTPGS